MSPSSSRPRYAPKDARNCGHLCSCSGFPYHSGVRNKIIWSVFFFSICLSRQPDFVVQQWKVENGLPQSTVRCITQTPDGYLWVGTWNGLARFDGVRMTVFNASNTPELTASNIMSLFTDRRGQLWIGTEPGGLVRYFQGKFEAFDSTNGIFGTRILSVNEDNSGRLWCATERGFFVRSNDRFLRFTASNGLPRTYANQVLPLPNNRMYLGMVGFGAVVRLENDSLVIEDSFIVGGYAVTADSTGTLWYGFRGKGFVRRVHGKEFIDARFAADKTGETYILRDQTKWLLSSRNIRVISDGPDQLLERIDGISLSDITTVFEDREGNIWLGKEGGGLICLREKKIDVLSKQNGLGADLIMCGLEDRSLGVWIGTWDSALLYRKDPHSVHFEQVRLPKNVVSIYTLAESHKGGVWAGAWGAGLYYISGKKVERFNKGIFRDEVSIVSVAEDPSGGLWIGTAHDGVAHVRGDSITMWNSENGLSNNRVNAILCARNGDVWITASGSGVNRISNGVLTVHKKGSGLNDNFAAPMYEDRSGAVWIGTNRGVTRWKDGRFSSVTQEQGLYDDAVAQIIEDDLGNFWIGAIHGIYRVSGSELNAAADGTLGTVNCFTIGKEDGMIAEETGGGGTSRCWKTSDGKLWFSTAAGAVVIDPKSITSHSVPPSVTIEDVWVENQHRPGTEEIVLLPGETMIEVRFTGLNFTAPDKLRFQYLLAGSDKEWSELSVQRTVRYTNLDPGEYRFQVRTVNNAGLWSSDEAQLAVTVLPPFYATWWFRFLIALLFLTSGPAVYFFRVRQLTHEKEMQIEFSRRLIESQESERKRIATELHDGLGQNLLIIKNKLLTALRSPEAAPGSGGPVDEASELVSSTIEEVRSISHNLRPHQLDQLGLTKTLRSIVRRANESTDIECLSEIQDIDGLLTPEQEISLYRIVQESFNNIIKHSGAARAMLRIHRQADAIRITVEDNGRGFPAASVPGTDRVTGFGITGMVERAKMFNWMITIESKSGTRLSITIPI